MAGCNEVATINGSDMKTNAIAGLLFAGALVAFAQSPRVGWIPTTLSEIINYEHGQINDISVGLVCSNADGTLRNVSVWAGNSISRSGNSWDLEGSTSNFLRSYL